jgi:hypothetical protein
LRAVGSRFNMGWGSRTDKGVANDKGVVKFRKVEIKPL